MEGAKPDLVMGYFNIVENPEIDRLVNRGGADPASVRSAFSDFTTGLNLADGWRRRNPTERGYTYMGRSQSRLDRVYVNEVIYPWCTDWAIEHPAVRTLPGECQNHVRKHAVHGQGKVGNTNRPAEDPTAEEADTARTSVAG